jgi:hypothetical protein
VLACIDACVCCRRSSKRRVGEEDHENINMIKHEAERSRKQPNAQNEGLIKEEGRERREQTEKNRKRRERANSSE